VKPIRILFVVNGFAIGGGELKLLELVAELKRRYSGRYRMVVAAVGQGGPLEKQFEKVADKMVVYSKKHKYDVSQVWRLYRLILNERVNIVQTTLFYADVIGTLAARLAGVKNIISWEANTERGKSSRRKKNLKNIISWETNTQPYGTKHMTAYRLAAKGFRISVSVSNAIRKQVMEDRHVSPVKTRTVHYGVDVNRFHPVSGEPFRKSLGIPMQCVVFGTIARLSEPKGHHYLIQAVPAVVRRFPNIRFVFAGDGPLRKSLESQTKALGIESYVQFLGFRTDVVELMAAFDAFVLPSLYEGLPNAVLEAMACGKPVVATAVDGTPEIVVHGETGLLVPAKDPDALAEAILRIAGNPHFRRWMGSLARRRIVLEHGLDDQVDAFHALYQELFNS
jgi:glycosyltransferase involved in cell wall biosynthesis